MARTQNKESRDVLPAADVKVMVMQLADSARRLKDLGDFEGANDAANTALMYSADAGMDPRFSRALRKIQEEVGDPSNWGLKFNPEPPRMSIKAKLLR